MNLLFTIDDLAPEAGGPSRTLPALCTALAHLGHRVEIVCQSPARGRTSPLLPDGRLVATTVARRPAPAFGALGLSEFRRAVETRAREMRADVLHDNGIWSSANHAVALASRSLGLPRVVSVRGMLRPWALKQKRMKKLLGWVAYQRRDLASAQCLLASSEDEAAEIVRLKVGVPVAMVPHGVDVRPPRNLRRSARTRTVLFLARLVPNKGLSDLVDAWAQIRPEGWRVVVAGPDDAGHGRDIRERAAAAGIGGDFEFTGVLGEDAKWRALADADLFVLPTHGENFGLAIAEALAAGVPVVTTKSAPWPEIETRRCGWWVDRGTGPLSRALREALAASDETLGQMGHRGRVLVKERFGWRGVAERMVLVYAWLAGTGPKPGFVTEPNEKSAR